MYSFNFFTFFFVFPSWPWMVMGAFTYICCASVDNFTNDFDIYEEMEKV